MLGSMTPLGERSRNQRWWLTWIFYISGSAVAGSLIGAALGTLGEAAFPPSTDSGVGPTAALAALIVIGLLVDLGLIPLTLPTIHRQVRQDWLYQFRGWFYGLGFGFQLGLGVVTIVNTAAIYVALAASFLSAQTLVGLAIGGCFGLLRALPILSVVRIQNSDQFDLIEPTLSRLDQRSRQFTAFVQAALVPPALVLGLSFGL